MDMMTDHIELMPYNDDQKIRQIFQIVYHKKDLPKIIHKSFRREKLLIL